MMLKEFAKRLDGRKYGYPQFTKEELSFAKEHGFVIVYGASDDLLELGGAIEEEYDVFDGGAVRVDTPAGMVDIRAKWCEEQNESIQISWVYELSGVEYETFYIYDEEDPYCRACVFQIPVTKKERVSTQKVYISGPISGSMDYMERFSAAEDALIKKGYSVINPAKIGACLPEDTTHEQYMQMSIALMQMANAIYMLPGWEQSKGASFEHFYAEILNLEQIEE